MEQVLYPLPDGWEWSSFNHIFSTKGFSVGKVKSSEVSHEGLVPVVDQSQSFIAGYSDCVELTFSGKLPVLIYGDHTNCVKFVDFEFICGADGTKVLAIENDIHPKYAFYLVSKFRPETQGYRRHFSLLKNLFLPVPPPHEQKRIVEKLDALLSRIDTAIEHLQESVTLADALYASLLDQAFNPKSPSSNEDGTNQLPNGWRKVPLGTIVELSQGTQIPVGDQFVEQDEGFIRFLRISDFVRYDEPPRYILYPGPQYIVQEDDVCMIRYGDAGRAVTGLAGALANNLFKISPNEMLSKRFLFLQLQSPRCVEYLRASNNSSTMPAISFKAVNAMEFNLPPLDEQQQIIEKLNNANKLYLALKGLFENKIRYFNDLKASMLDFAFKGEL